MIWCICNWDVSKNTECWDTSKLFARISQSRCLGSSDMIVRSLGRREDHIYWENGDKKRKWYPTPAGIYHLSTELRFIPGHTRSIFSVDRCVLGLWQVLAVSIKKELRFIRVASLIPLYVSAMTLLNVSDQMIWTGHWGWMDSLRKQPQALDEDGWSICRRCSTSLNITVETVTNNSTASCEASGDHNLEDRWSLDGTLWREAGCLIGPSNWPIDWKRGIGHLITSALTMSVSL